MRRMLLLLIALIVSTITALSMEFRSYDQLDGFWSDSKECGADQNVYLSIRQGFYFDSYKDEKDEWRTSNIAMSSFVFRDDVLIEQYLENGVYSTNFITMDTDHVHNYYPGPQAEHPIDLNSLPIELKADEKSTYYRCRGAPHGSALTFSNIRTASQILATAKLACAASVASCLNSLFAQADITGNGELSAAEISRVVKLAAFVGTTAKDGGATNSEIAGSLMVSALMAPIIANGLVSGSDYDASGQLSLAEVLQDFDLDNIEGAASSLTMDVVGQFATQIASSAGGLVKLLGSF